MVGFMLLEVCSLQGFAIGPSRYTRLQWMHACWIWHIAGTNMHHVHHSSVCESTHTAGHGLCGTTCGGVACASADKHSTDVVTVPYM
jgi:hypothetical protein